MFKVFLSSLSVSVSAIDPADHFYWIASRSIGIVAMGLLTLSVVLGLLASGRLSEKPGRKRVFVVVHEVSAVLSMILLVAHGALLLGDNYLSPSVHELLFPFAMSYRPVWTGLGIVGGWIALILGLSFYMRRRIGATVWLKLHRFILIAWLLGMVHAVGAGTDMTNPLMRIYLLAQGVAVTTVLIARLLPRGSKRRVARRGVAQAER